MRRTILAAVVFAVGTTGAAAAQGADAQPIATAHQVDFQIGQLATVRGQSPQVRQFGQALMDDHGEALERLASESRVTWPIEIDAKHRQLEQELSTLDGRAFDRRFVDAMVEDHEALATLLRGQAGATPATARASSSTDGAVGTSGTSGGSRSAASPTLRAVEKHLAEARRLQRTLGGR
jgi:predicted outer membrane protein